MILGASPPSTYFPFIFDALLADMKYRCTKSLFFLVAESVENTVDSNGEKRDDFTSPLGPSDNVERYKRITEDLAEERISGKCILTFLLHPLFLYVILNSSLLKYVLKCL